MSLKEALNTSSMNDQSGINKKCDFCLFDIFNDLTVIENGGADMYHRKP